MCRNLLQTVNRRHNNWLNAMGAVKFACVMMLLLCTGCVTQERICELSQSNERKDRKQAVDLIYQSGNPSYRYRLRALALDSDPCVRGYVICKMGTMRDGAFSDLMMDALKDDRFWQDCRIEWGLLHTLTRAPISETANWALERVTGCSDPFVRDEGGDRRQQRMSRWCLRIGLPKSEE